MKKIETRSWSTAYRGPLAIHAAKELGPVGGNRGFYELCCGEPFYSALNDICGSPFQLPRGAIVAVCELVGCVRIAQVRQTHTIDLQTFIVPPYTDLPEYAFGDYSPGRFAWLLADARPLPEPIPARGAIGLWEWEDAR
jgi:hypothetical protein